MNQKTALSITRIVLSSILFFFLLWNISAVWKTVLWLVGVLSPLIVGLCFAFIINPLVSSIERLLFTIRKKPPTKRVKSVFRGLSILLSFLVVFGVLTILLLIILPEVSSTLSSFIYELPSVINSLVAWIHTLPIDTSIIDEFFQNQSSLDTIIQRLTDFFKNGMGTDVVNGVLGATASLLGGLWSFILGLIISVYTLAQKEAIGSFFSRFIRAFLKHSSERIFYVAKLADDAFTNFVSGQLLEALILGTLCYFGMSIFRFPYSLTIATIIALTALIPVFGAWIGAILGALLILTDSPMQALWFLVFLIILQQIEGNLIYPRVVGKSVGLPAILVMLSVSIGGGVSGVLGMLLSVPLCSLCYTLVKEAIASRLGPVPAPAPDPVPTPPSPDEGESSK